MRVPFLLMKQNMFFCHFPAFSKLWLKTYFDDGVLAFKLLYILLSHLIIDNDAII